MMDWILIISFVILWLCGAMWAYDGFQIKKK